MKCRLGNVNLKIWGKALQTMIATGDDDVHFVFRRETVTVTTLDSSLAVCCTCSFQLEFFDSYEQHDEKGLACRVPSKCLLKPFRSLRFLTKAVASCTISCQEGSDKLSIVLTTKTGPEITYKLRLVVETDEIELDCRSDNLCNWLKVDPKFILVTLSNFGPTTHKVADLTLQALNNKVILKNCSTDFDKREGKVYTELSVNSVDFLEFLIREEGEITIPLRELKAFASFAEELRIDLSIHFEKATDPVIIILQNYLYKAVLTMATKVSSGNGCSQNECPGASGVISTTTAEMPVALPPSKKASNNAKRAEDVSVVEPIREGVNVNELVAIPSMPIRKSTRETKAADKSDHSAGEPLVTEDENPSCTYRHLTLFEWNWDKSMCGFTTEFLNNDTEVMLHRGNSIGTAAVRGRIPLRKGYHHYWQVEMNTAVYGTDMMIGVGTEQTDFSRYTHKYLSLLGLDENSWGLSYRGETYHLGKKHAYTKPFGKHDVVAVHLDSWLGTLEYYINGEPQGIAFKGLKDMKLFPMICSTASSSGMKLISSISYPPSLQIRTLLSLSRQMLYPKSTPVVKFLALPPVLKMRMNVDYWWIWTTTVLRRSKRPLNESIASSSEYECPGSSGVISTTTAEMPVALPPSKKESNNAKRAEEVSVLEPLREGFNVNELVAVPSMPIRKSTRETKAADKSGHSADENPALSNSVSLSGRKRNYVSSTESEDSLLDPVMDMENQAEDNQEISALRLNNNLEGPPRKKTLTLFDIFPNLGRRTPPFIPGSVICPDSDPDSDEN